MSRAAACCMLALLLTACLGPRSEREREQTYAPGYAPYVLDIDEDLELDGEMNSAWANPGELVDDAVSHPDMCVGDCLAEEYGNEHGFLPWEEPDDLTLGAEPLRPRRAAPRRDPVRRGSFSRAGRGMAGASMPSGRIPRPPHELAAMCNGSQTICISSPFGVQRPGHLHKGVDISAPFGSPIKAFRSGVVTEAQWHHSYGKIVEIRQDDGLIARYAHMSQILVRAGERVWQGQPIGRVGSTGRSTGPHLHFELIRGSQHMNPMVHLQAPGHVVSRATERDAAQARVVAMSSGGAPSGRYGYAGRQRVVDRHAPARPGRVAMRFGKPAKAGPAAAKRAGAGSKAKAQDVSVQRKPAAKVPAKDRSAAKGLKKAGEQKPSGKGARSGNGVQKPHDDGKKAAPAKTQAKPAQPKKAEAKGKTQKSPAKAKKR